MTASDENSQFTLDPDEKKRIANRLRRAHGQLAAVIAALERDDDCRQVVTQLAAASKALDRAGFAMIACGMRASASTEGEGPVSEAELERLFLSLT